MSKYAMRRYACIDCGQACERKRKSTQLAVCVECGIRRAVEAAEAMSTKSGEKWGKFQKSRGPLGGGAHQRRE